ncbi:MAG: WG repeat-containing protein [Clostridiales bacterium]|nr:WG repeat-containing protein [Clostridiales bacterium]
MQKKIIFLLVACLALTAGCGHQTGPAENGGSPAYSWVEDNGKRALADYEDYELVVYRDADTQKCGFADLFGNIVVEAEFDEAYPFNQGLARVGEFAMDRKSILEESEVYYEDLLKCKYTYIDKNGNFIKDYTWDIAFEFNRFEVATVGIGEILITDSLHFEGSYGLIDKFGDYVCPLEWEGDLISVDAQMSEEGLMPVWLPLQTYPNMHQNADDDADAGAQPLLYRLGYADYVGNIAIPPSWGYGEGFKNGLAVVSREDMQAYQFFFDDYDSTDPDVWFTGRYSVIDTTGETVLEITRDMLNETGKFHAWVYVVGGEYVMVDLFEAGGGLGSRIKTIYLDLDGNIVPEGDIAHRGINFWRGNTICVDENTGKFGIHSNGKLIVAPIFDELTNPYSASADYPVYAGYNGAVKVYYAKIDGREGYIYVEGAN